MNIRPGILFILCCLSFLPAAAMPADDDTKLTDFSDAENHLTLLGGYSTGHPGLGATDTRVQSIDFIAQYGYFLTPETGKSWYKGRHKIIVEVPFSAVYRPGNAVMTGISFLGAWDFTASKTTVPYVFGGGGFVYTDLNDAGFGSDYNGNYQGGFGVHYLFKERMYLNLSYRLHHISNAGTADPNTPLNSSRFFIGISFLD